MSAPSLSETTGQTGSFGTEATDTTNSEEDNISGYTYDPSRPGDLIALTRAQRRRISEILAMNLQWKDSMLTLEGCMGWNRRLKEEIDFLKRTIGVESQAASKYEVVKGYLEKRIAALSDLRALETDQDSNAYQAADVDEFATYNWKAAALAEAQATLQKNTS